MLYIIYPDVDIWNYVFDGYDGKNNVLAVPLNRNCSKLQLVFRKSFPTLKSNIHLLFGSKICYSLKSLKESDSLLICDYTDLCILKTIAGAVDPKVKKNLWLWNPINGKGDTNFNKLAKLIKQVGFEIFTFDKDDAQKYNLNWLTQFSKSPVINVLPAIEQDFYFMGFEKGRKQILDKLSVELEGYKLNFRTINNSKYGIDYSVNISNIMRSHCLVEIVQEGQAGLTLRSLEAMFMKKKLLTNNKDIKNMDFYSPSNVFVYGEDEIGNIGTFLNTPFVNVPEEIQYKYSMDCWISNFKN